MADISGFDPSPGIGTKAASPVPNLDAATVIGDMYRAIRDKLVAMTDEFSTDLQAVKTAYADIPDEIKSHPMYKALGERISSVEALWNTLNHTTASFK